MDPTQLILILSSLVISEQGVLCCKKAPPPRCHLPDQTKLKTHDPSAALYCTGFANRYYNIPKVYDDIKKALTKEGAVMENGTLVVKEELIAPQEKDLESTFCHLVCSNGYIPTPTSSISCNKGVWTQEPSTLTCTQSPCGHPSNPTNGRYHCYGNPSTCYLTCNPGYATMDLSPQVTCQGGDWDRDPLALQCEEAVALMTGGIGTEVGKGPFPERCHTAEVFSPWDETCSSLLKPLLKIGVHDHTSHLVGGEILVCGGNECGRTSEKLFSKKTIYNDTVTNESCFKMLEDNSWAFHSKFPEHSWRWNHLGVLQQNKLEIIGGHNSLQEPVLELSKAGWVKGRAPSLPPTVWATSIGRPCVVVTSPVTFVVTGGSSDLLAGPGKHKSSVLEFNSLTKEWRPLPDMPIGRADHACALVTTEQGDGIMIVGGRNTKEQKYGLRDAHIFDIRTQIWYPAGEISYGRRDGLQMAVLGERIFVFGSSHFIEGKHTSEEERVEEYRVTEHGCENLKDCSPQKQGSWFTTSRKIGRRTGHAVLAVPRSRFNCTVG